MLSQCLPSILASGLTVTPRAQGFGGQLGSIHLASAESSTPYKSSAFGHPASPSLVHLCCFLTSPSQASDLGDKETWEDHKATFSRGATVSCSCFCQLWLVLQLGVTAGAPGSNEPSARQPSHVSGHTSAPRTRTQEPSKGFWKAQARRVSSHFHPFPSLFLTPA